MSRRRRALLPVLFLLAGLPSRALAGDVTAFVAWGSPSENWRRGYGGTLSSTWFEVLSFEGEAARMAGESLDSNMTTFTGSALLAPPIGAFTPYGGIGAGLFRQAQGEETDLGFLKAFVLGAKLRIGTVLVLKGEYRRIDLSGEPLMEMEQRLSFGAGIAF